MWFQNRRTKWRKRHAADMATAKKRQDGELSQKILADVNKQQADQVVTSQSTNMTSQSTDFFSPNQMQVEKKFSNESGSTKEGEESEKSDGSSPNSSQNIHDNHHRGVSMATSNSQSSAFKPMIDLFSGAYRQQGVQNNPLDVAMFGGGVQRGENAQQGFPQQRNIVQS